MDSYTRPDLARSALITIDTQNDFTLDGAPASIPGTGAIIPNMRRLLDLYREQGRTILHVVRLYRTDASNVDLCRKRRIEQGQQIVAPGTDGAELVQGLKPDGSARLYADMLLSGGFQALGHNEYVMYKPRWGAFYGTRLEGFLNDRGIDSLVFCGCNYPNCPRTSIYQASERDFRIVLVTDALSQFDDTGRRDMANIGVELLETGTVEQRLRALRA